MKQVLISYYDPEPIRNILALLHARYDKVYILYYPIEGTPSKAEREKLAAFMQRRFSIVPEYVRVSSNTIEAYLAKFRTFLRPYGEYEFDAAGDSSAFVAAAGILLRDRPDARLSLIRYSPRTDRMQLRYPAEPEERPRRFELTVADRIALKGTFFTRGERDGIPVCDEAHDRELLTLWNTVKKNPVAWNKFCMLRPTAETEATWLRRLATVEEKKLAAKIIPELTKAGLIERVQSLVENGREQLSFVPTLLPENLELLQKAGLALERYAYRCAVQSGLFSDARTGVEIDWDGLPSTGADNPYNEIDLILVFGNLIAFGSCKNREPNKDDLYEISVLTRHFGGKYAVPMLLCTLPAPSPTRERAKEMGVFLIDNIKNRSEKSMVQRYTEMIRQNRKE